MSQAKPSRVRVAVVGAGYWGPNLVRVMADLSEAELVFVCDADEGSLAKIRESFPGVPLSRDPAEVFESPRVDAVVLATNPHTHYDLGTRALAAGKHLYVEKPLALTVEHGEALVAKAEAAGRTLMVGHLMRYHPAVHLLQRYVDSGELGEVLYVYATRVNLGKLRREENALWSLAPHDISVILHLLGSFPRRVRALGVDYVRGGVEDVVFLTMEFPNKVLAQVHVSWLDPHKVRQLTVVGKKKMAVLDDMEATEKIRIYDKGVDFTPSYRGYGESLTLRVGDILVPRVEMTEPLHIECAHFVECVAKGQRPWTDGHEGLRVLRVLDAAQRSLESQGNYVDLPEPDALGVRAGSAGTGGAARGSEA